MPEPAWACLSNAGHESQKTYAGEKTDQSHVPPHCQPETRDPTPGNTPLLQWLDEQLSRMV
jgi:hypothetical protein